MDELLIRKAKRGDPDSFDQLIQQVRDQAYRVAYCYLHNEYDSMDAVCDGVEKAFRNLKKLKEPKYFRTWFIRIVINECKLQLRAKEKVTEMADSIYTDEARGVLFRQYTSTLYLTNYTSVLTAFVLQVKPAKPSSWH